MAKAKQSHRPPSQAKGATGQRNGATRQSTAARPVSRASTGNGASASSARVPATAPATPRNQRIQARANQRRRYQKTAWWQQKNVTLFGILGALLILIIVFFLFANKASSGNSGNAQLAPASVVHPVTNVSEQVSATVGTGGVPNPIKSIPPGVGGGNLTNNGKPVVLYMGAEYCPYCAAERWSMIVALSRFGTFTNLHLTTSSSTDVYPDTPTFTFYGSTYTSKYLDFQSVELTTRDQNTPLETPTSQQQHLMDLYDTPTYVGGTTSGGIPFINFGNQYVASSSGYSPQILGGQTQQDIANKLSNANDATTQQIVGNANWLTATICKLTNNQPGNVCTTGAIPSIQAQLPAGQ